MANNIIGITEIAIIWGLESGFKSDMVNENRDAWFAANKSFVVKQDKYQKLVFISLEAFLTGTEDVKEYWTTSPVTLVEKSDDGAYRCYQTEHGTRYHIYKKGTIERP